MDLKKAVEQAGTGINRWYGVPAVLLILVAVIITLLPAWQSHHGGLWGDSYTYISFARSLAQGNIRLEGVVAEQIRGSFEREGEAVQGTIWNTHVLPDGDTVYTVAIGYPLFLALMLKLGGTWLCMHANFLLLGLMLLMLFFVVYEGLGRSPTALLAAGAAVILLPHVDPATFRQFSYPWREPLFCSCLLLSVYALLRFSRSGSRGWLLLAPLAAGYACAVKEVNVIYVVCLAVWVLAMPGYRKRKDRWVLVGWAALAFVVGCLPLLVQNAVSTGNPLMSLQTLRATGEYSVKTYGQGLSAGNSPDTVKNYIRMYGLMTWFKWPLLLLAGWGVLISLGCPLGRVFVGMAIMHLLLYLQWGNADYRHMFFINIPYTFFLVYGVYWLIDVPWRFLPRIARPVRITLCLAGCVALLFWPSPWSVEADGDLKLFDYQTARSVAAQIENDMEPGSLVLVNRSVRDVLAAYANVEVIRLHDLARVRSDHEVEVALRRVMEQGVPLYFLDNEDRDPKHHQRVNWAKEDEELLLEHYNLVPVAAYDRDVCGLGSMISADEMTLYQVQPWTQQVVEATLPVPPAGAAWLFVNPRDLDGKLSVELNGEPLTERICRYYYPVFDRSLGPQATVTCRADGHPLSDRLDLKFIGWEETVTAPMGSDAQPRDIGYFGVDLSEALSRGWRGFPGTNQVPLRLPVRARSNLFTAVSLFIKGTNDTLDIDIPGKAHFRLPRSDAWFSLGWLQARSKQDFAGELNLTVRALSGEWLRFEEAKLVPARQQLSLTVTNPAVRFVAVTGRLVPADYGYRHHDYKVFANRELLDASFCDPNPSASVNASRVVVEIKEGQSKYDLFWRDAGIIDPQLLPVENVLKFSLAERKFMALFTGVYGWEQDETGEHFCWTRNVMNVRVPVSGAKRYRLRFRALDGHPLHNRTLKVRYHFHEMTFELNGEKQWYECSFSVPQSGSGVDRVKFEIASWSPAELLGVADNRELGFRIYAFEWVPGE